MSRVAIAVGVALLLRIAAPAAAQEAPKVTTVAPATRLPGEIVDVGGQGLGPGARVDFVSKATGAARTPGPVAAWDDRLQRLRVAVPPLAPGRYQVQVTMPAGAAAGAGFVTVPKPPRAKARPAATRLAAAPAIAAMLRHHGETGWIPKELAERLAADASAGKYPGVREALEAEEAAVLADAVRAAGPVAADVVLVAYRTGQPIKKVAMDWRHCHVLRGAALVLDPACGPGSKAHAHLVVEAGGSDRATFLAAEGGKRPPRIAPHQHTEAGFDAGQIVAGPSVRQGWFDGLALLPDVFRWIDGHAPELRAGHVMALNATCTVIACTSYQPTCPVALAHPTQAALKAAAEILVGEGLVHTAPVTREKALELLSGIQ